ncbi:TMEM165/GDT1 family protein [Kineococcus rhizosphaerae]|uniref:TMEM165/GDT1 family protein n=1 Tax=Kineococcus rhizosphaerae TaxID=559628 RepID=UPI000D0614BF|nr:TMEM165/GDT1 family protein [Kineococcus rhizosphaerae]
MDPAVLAASFLPILLLELPDKTFVATLVLATRFRPLTAWIGVGLAFAVQCLIAVVAGRLLAQLPDRPVAAVAALLFAVGAFTLFRGAAKAQQAEEEARVEYEGKVRGGTSGWRAVLACFGVIFLAEWGDLSQLFTAGLAARYDDPVSVFAGSWAALLVVSGLAAAVGGTIVRKLSVAAVSRVGGVVCAVLAVLTALEVAGLDLPV